jgi:hypothetical protein
VLAAGLVVVRAKAFTDDVGGDARGVLWASFFSVVGTIAGHQALAAPGARGENSVRRWTCDGGAFGAVPSLEASHRELVLTCGSGVLVGRWSCSCATAADEEHKVRVGGEVRRGHGGRQPWAGVHGVVVFLASAWCRWCS